MAYSWKSTFARASHPVSPRTNPGIPTPTLLSPGALLVDPDHPSRQAADHFVGDRAGGDGEQDLVTADGVGELVISFGGHE